MSTTDPISLEHSRRAPPDRLERGRREPPDRPELVEGHSLCKHLPLIAAAPGGIKKLRELILELAVRGKLVPQDPSDEPASELLKWVEAEREVMCARGRIKKGESLPPPDDSEQPFPIPSSWAWVRLESLFEIKDHKRVPVNKRERESRHGPFPYYGANGRVGFIDDYLFSGEHVLVAEDGGFFNDPIRGVAYHVEGKFWVNNHAHVLRPLAGTAIKYWVSFFKAMSWDNYIRGDTRSKLNQRIMLTIPMAVPPRAEQHRIVAKVDELMALCDRLEAQQADAEAAHTILVKTLLDTLTQSQSAEDFTANWQRLSAHFDTLFTTESSIDALKQTLLQLAVMGKLVPQDPSDEPANELRKRLLNGKKPAGGRVEGKRSVTGGNGQAIPFPLPAGWVWIAVGDLGRIAGGATPSKSNPSFWNGTIPWVSPKDMKRPFIEDAADHVSPVAVEKTALKLLPPQSLLLVVRGMILAHSFPVAVSQVPLCINQDMKTILIPPEIVEFVPWVFRGLKNNFLNLVERSTHGTCKIKSELLFAYPFPLPPLAEQKRIAVKLDELMVLCNLFKQRLGEARALQQRFAEVLVKQGAAT